MQVIDHQDQLIVMIAILRDDIDAGLGQRACNRAKLARLFLLQAPHEHLSNRDHVESGGKGRRLRALTIMDQEMSVAFPVRNKDTAALKADAGFTHDSAEQG